MRKLLLSLILCSELSFSGAPTKDTLVQEGIDHFTFVLSSYSGDIGKDNIRNINRVVDDVYSSKIEGAPEKLQKNLQTIRNFVKISGWGTDKKVWDYLRFARDFAILPNGDQAFTLALAQSAFEMNHENRFRVLEGILGFHKEMTKSQKTGADIKPH